MKYSPVAKGKINKQKIIAALIEHDRWLTIKELAAITQINPCSIRNHLDNLKRVGRVNEKQIALYMEVYSENPGKYKAYMVAHYRLN